MTTRLREATLIPQHMSANWLFDDTLQEIDKQKIEPSRQELSGFPIEIEQADQSQSSPIQKKEDSRPEQRPILDMENFLFPFSWLEDEHALMVFHKWSAYMPHIQRTLSQCAAVEEYPFSTKAIGNVNNIIHDAGYEKLVNLTGKSSVLHALLGDQLMKRTLQLFADARDETPNYQARMLLKQAFRSYSRVSILSNAPADEVLNLSAKIGKKLTLLLLGDRTISFVDIINELGGCIFKLTDPNWIRTFYSSKSRGTIAARTHAQRMINFCQEIEDYLNTNPNVPEPETLQ